MNISIDIITQLVEGLKTMYGLIIAWMINVFAWWLVLNAVYKIMVSTRRASSDISFAGQGFRVCLGAMLTQFSTFTEGVVVGLTNRSVDMAGPMSITPVGQGTFIVDTVRVVFLFLFVTGIASIAWGVRLWARAADGATGGKGDSSPSLVGSVHIIFGAISINAWRWADLLT